MDILLIDPPQAVLKGQPVNRAYYMGLTSLAAYLRNAGFETAVLTGDLLMDSPSAKSVTTRIPNWLRTDVKELAARQRELEATVNDKTHAIWQRLTETVRRANPAAVGISYLTPLKCVVERIAGLIRELDPDIKIIVGSFHPTFCPDEVMQNPDIDFVIRGEGEIPLLHLVKELKKDSPKWETVPGIHYRGSDGQVQSNPCADPISNLDELPFPARHLVLSCDFDRYRLHSMATARGCPYTCAFCADRNFWGGKIRRRSVDNVIAELKQLKDNYKVSYVDIVDGTFTFDRKYLQTFCNAMIDQKLNLEWRCTARYDNLDEDLLRLMKRANCNGLYLGLESGSNKVLKAIDKRETIESIIEVSKMVYDSGMISATSVILGTPDEEKEDIEETLKVMKKFKTDFFDVNSYMPLAGTRLYESMGEEEKKNIDWRKVGYKSFDTYFAKRMSPDEFQRYQSEAYKIANDVRKKALVRLGSRMLLRSVANAFRKIRK